MNARTVQALRSLLREVNGHAEGYAHAFRRDGDSRDMSIKSAIDGIGRTIQRSIDDEMRTPPDVCAACGAVITPGRPAVS